MNIARRIPACGIVIASMMLAAGSCQAAPAPASDPLPTPNTHSVIKMLHDRKATLHDFTAKLDYSVYHPDTLDETGKQGTVDFIMDPVKGPIFTVDLTDNTEERKPKRKYHQQVLFDGVTVTTLDYEARQFTHSVVLPDGAKPGDAVSLTGPLPLPIGISEDEVTKHFDISLIPNAKDVPAANCVTLRLIPHKGETKFDFHQMDIVVDQKLELPVQLKQTSKNDEITTITLTELHPNEGKAKMGDPTPPANANPAWTERVLSSTTTPGKSP